MEDRIEQIITNIEQSFNNLKTSVEQLQKAENIASISVATTSTLINEFNTSIKSIEKLVKIDFANEYNKLADLNNNLLVKINKFDFDNKFQSVENKILDKNFDTKFSELTTAISNKNFNLNFQSMEEKIRDKNFDNKFQSVEQKITEKNFDSKFQSIQNILIENHKESKQLISSTNTEMINLLNRHNEIRDKKNKQLIEQIEIINSTQKKNKLVLNIICSILVLGTVGVFIIIGIMFYFKVPPFKL
jgi:succinate dehydrogenase flavin-adding protein (antitoxin of CptAB toxin-antitoxin module)